MDYSSKIRLESAKYPGVSFSIRKMTVRRRASLAEMQAEATARLAVVQWTIAPLIREYRAAEKVRKEAPEGAEAPVFPEEKLAELVRLAEAAWKIEDEELAPAAVEFSWVGIEGLTIEGAPATLAMLRADEGPDGLYGEIVAAVKTELELSAEERENLWSPSTSAAAVDGGDRNGSATPVERLVTITPRDAPNSMAPASASA